MSVMASTRSAILANPWASMSCIAGWCWGIILAMPGDTLARPTYRYMQAIAEEEYWTVTFLLVAALQTWRLYQKTTEKLFPYEIALKGVACVIWTYTAFACLAAQWPLAAAMSDGVAVAIASWIDISQCSPCYGCPWDKTGKCTHGCFIARNDDAY